MGPDGAARLPTVTSVNRVLNIEGLKSRGIRVYLTVRAAVFRYSLDVLVAVASGIELWRQLGPNLLVIAVGGAVLGGLAVDRAMSYLAPRLRDVRQTPDSLPRQAAAPSGAKGKSNTGAEPVQVLFDNLKLHRGFLMSWSAWFYAGDRAIADLHSDNPFYAGMYSAAEYAQLHNRFYGAGLAQRPSERAFHFERTIDRDGEYRLAADQGWEKRTVYLSVKWVRIPRTRIAGQMATGDPRLL